MQYHPIAGATGPCPPPRRPSPTDRPRHHTDLGWMYLHSDFNRNMSKLKILVSYNNFPPEITAQLMETFVVKMIKKPMTIITKQDILDNIPGTFGLIISRVKIPIDEHLIEIADKLPTSLGTGLTNSVVGIIGCANIGIAVAKMLSGFKMSELLYTSRKPKLEVECLGEQLVTTDDLVGRNDFIIMATVLVPETMHIINKYRLALMKPNAVIINVSRGIILPHIAGRNTIEAAMEKAQLTINNIFCPIPYILQYAYILIMCIRMFK